MATSKQDREYCVYILYEHTNIIEIGPNRGICEKVIVHYVGITDDLARRYYQHCRCMGTNLELNLWIQEKLRSNTYPSFDTIHYFIKGHSKALELETHYISYYLSQGMPLKNIRQVQGVRQ